MLLVATAAGAGTLSSPADELSPIALFNRCYGTIVRERLPKSHRFYHDVKSGDMDPVDACMQVLEDSQFSEQSPDPTEKVKVIQTFSDFHRRWFQTDNYTSVLPVGEVYGAVTRLLHDPGEPAHYVTRAVFGGQDYSSIVTEASGLVALRQPGDLEAVHPGAGGMGGFMYNNGTNPEVPYAPPLQGTGDVVGIVRTVDKPEYAGAVLNPVIHNDITFGNVVPYPKPLPLFAHFGGGVIGSQSYLMLNFGRVFEDNDGGMRVPRRWAKAVVQDLLCRDVPAIRLEDAEPLVDANSQLPFRKQASCMQCHGALDPLADTARNLRYVGTVADFIKYSVSIQMGAYDVTGQSYATSEPTGKLVYRSYTGDLVSLDVKGLGGVGQAISQSDDFYVCAASRYFELFTGLRVNLQDLGDKSSQKLDAANLAYRKRVIGLGLELKKHNSVLKLIREILKTDFYKTAGMRQSIKVE
jgi:hypothetical protein